MGRSSREPFKNKLNEKWDLYKCGFDNIVQFLNVRCSRSEFQRLIPIFGAIFASPSFHWTLPSQRAAWKRILVIHILNLRKPLKNIFAFQCLARVGQLMMTDGRGPNQTLVNGSEVTWWSFDGWFNYVILMMGDDWWNKERVHQNACQCLRGHLIIIFGW